MTCRLVDDDLFSSFSCLGLNSPPTTDSQPLRDSQQEESNQGFPSTTSPSTTTTTIGSIIHESVFLNEGASGTVYRIDLKEKEDVAVKVFYNQNHYDQEFRILSNLKLCQIPNVIQMLPNQSEEYPFTTTSSSSSSSSRSFWCLWLPYYKKGDLFRMINHEGGGRGLGLSNMQRCKRYFKTLITTLFRMHDQLAVNHLDVKPENILVRDDEQDIVLVDFALSMDWKAERKHVSSTPERTCSLLYASPEVILGKRKTRDDFFQADLYSAILVLCAMVFGWVPIQAKHKISQHHYTRAKHDYYLSGFLDIARKDLAKHKLYQLRKKDFTNAMDLIQRGLQWHVKDRLSYLEVLNHPFLKSNNHSNSPLTSPTVCRRLEF